MKRYILTTIIAVAVIGLFQFIEIPLFNLDLTKRTKEALFVLRDERAIDHTLVLFNIGKLYPEELEIKIDSLLIAEPKKIGINLCHFNRMPKALIKKYKSDKRVIFTNCESIGMGTLAQIIEDGNIVTRFKTHNSDYFELQLTDFKGRENVDERINFGPRLYKGELSDPDFWFDPEYLQGKIILLGYMGDYLTHSIYYYQKLQNNSIESTL